ncbi:monovalent cation:proton antiporter-2 (CPA2) family protein [Thalassobaculum litoreum]|uniref:Kef-type potassium/proton antiporter, CPA2 family n=1 Tax=Thalassobaculum litoreum DSM 18839 TaxID=1123362 RepID=A0A8G2BF22_9PROT|nr:monovalent cation:proton antiporter-2 (CPA2) family protein [Thalassobaculum litoreum]SDF28725.1 Kef-type potassium/proton antiporter, CPA2 family [Thalassobaculum litoreum DSM 18839]
MESLLDAFDTMQSSGHGSPIGDALIFLAAAVLFAPLLRRLKFSLVLGYLAAGAMIGPHGLSIIDDVTETRELAEIGVVFLLFTIGLELSFARLKVMRRLVFGFGTAQVVLTGFLVAVISLFMGQTYGAAVTIGAALALSSTAFVLQLMNERGELATRHGRAAFSALLFQDLAVVPIVIVVPLLGREMDGLTILLELLKVTGTAFVALAVIVVAGRQLLRPLYHVIASAGAPELFTAMTLLVVLGIGWATQQVGLSMALGAFLAGLLLSESEFRHQVEADIEPFRGILLGLFFMTIGMSIDLGLAFREVFTVLGYLGGLVALKFVVVLGLAMAFRMPFAVSLRSAALLAQGGEFAFVILGIAAASSVVADDTVNLMFLVVAISMAVTPVIVWAIGKAAVLFENHENAQLSADFDGGHKMHDHVVIAGFGRVGHTIARLLDAKMVPYVAVDTDAQNVRDGRRDGHSVYYGDASRPEVLHKLGGENARAVVLTMSTGGHAVERTVQHLVSRLPDLPIFARARDPLHARRLEELGAAGTVVETMEASLQLGGAVLRQTGTEWGEIEDLIKSLRMVDGIGRKIGERPDGDSGAAAPPEDPLLAAALWAEEEEEKARNRKPDASMPATTPEVEASQSAPSKQDEAIGDPRLTDETSDADRSRGAEAGDSEATAAPVRDDAAERRSRD